MQYASTALISNIETVVVVLPLSLVPEFDPESPPQENTYCVGDEVKKGWVRIDGVFLAPAQTQEAVLAEKKRQRRIDVDAILVSTASGRIFNGDENSQNRMSRAINGMQVSGASEIKWVLANDVPTVVSLNELKEALSLAGAAQANIWSRPYE